MSKPICMATWRYKKPDSHGSGGLKALLKYVTFREDAQHIVPEDGYERWHDCGLGKSWREVYQHSRELAGRYILAHHFVVAPDPDLLKLLPQESRREAVAELTVQTIADWYQARDYAVPELSFVIHNRETTDANAPGRQMLHTHVFCAGTIPTLAGRECPMVKERDVVRNKGGLERETNLNRIAEQSLASILDREIGLEWRIGRELERHIDNGLAISIRQEQAPETLPEPTLELPKIDMALMVPPPREREVTRKQRDRSIGFDIS